MKRLFLLMAVMSTLAFGDEDPAQIGINISGGTSVTTNKLGGGRWYSLSCDGPVYYRTCKINTECTAVTTDPQIKNFDVPVPLYLTSGRSYFALLRVAAATTCHLYNYIDKG